MRRENRDVQNTLEEIFRSFKLSENNIRDLLAQFDENPKREIDFDLLNEALSDIVKHNRFDEIEGGFRALPPPEFMHLVSLLCSENEQAPKTEAEQVSRPSHETKPDTNSQVSVEIVNSEAKEKSLPMLVLVALVSLVVIVVLFLGFLSFKSASSAETEKQSQGNVQQIQKRASSVDFDVAFKCKLSNLQVLIGRDDKRVMFTSESDVQEQTISEVSFNECGRKRWSIRDSDSGRIYVLDSRCGTEPEFSWTNQKKELCL